MRGSATSAEVGVRSPVVDYLEEVAVDGLAKEETLEGRGAKRLHELNPAIGQPLLQGGEVRQRMIERHVPSEFLLERRDDEAFDEEHMDLLPASDVEPLRFDRDIVGHRITDVSEGLLEEPRRALDLLRWQREMGEAHGRGQCNTASSRRRSRDAHAECG